MQGKLSIITSYLQSSHAPMKHFPTKIYSNKTAYDLLICIIKAPENVKNVLENTQQKSLNIFYSKVWDPVFKFTKAIYI